MHRRCLYALAGTLFAGCAAAGEIEPRAYINTPVGVNFVLGGYAYSDGGLSTVASSPIDDSDLEIDTLLLAYARSFDFFGNSAKVDVILPYSDLDGTARVSGEPRERQVSGYNDPRFRLSVNFFGAPALSVKEFAGFQQDLILGASVQVSAPLGQYDEDRLVNLGTNRWFVKPELGISKAWGDLALELSSGVFVFSNNHHYYGDTNLQQAPLYTSQLHFTYNLRPGIWAALSATVDQGGRTEAGGVKNNDDQNNSRAGFTFAWSLNRNNSLKFYASNALHTRVSSDFDLVGIAWQYRWGGGL
jgi:hypothetical protein